MKGNHYWLKCTPEHPFYYKCGKHKRAECCHRCSLRKEVAEKIVIDRAIEIIQREGVFEFVAECAAKMQLQESSILPCFRRN